MAKGAEVIRKEFDRAEPWKPDAPEAITATPYVWRDPAMLPCRQWVYGKHLIRGYVSSTVSGGGVGKTALTIAEAVDMASAADIFRTGISEPLRVWLWNLEDPRDELERRIAAAVLHHGIDPTQIGDRLFLDSGRDNPLCIASETPNGACISEPVVGALIQELKARRIDVLRVDPFVSSHAVTENDNRAVDLVVKEWGRIAHETGCAIELVHHVRKQQAGSEVTADSARGAKALVDAARSVRVLSRMTKDEGARASVDNHRLHVRVDLDKQNLAPPSEVATWFKLESCALPNGDNVGVAVPWHWPDPFDGLTTEDLLRVQEALHGQEYRQNAQAARWAGAAIADVLGYDLSDESAKFAIKAMLKTWVNNGALVVSEANDGKGHMRPIIEVGKWANA